MFRNSIRRRFFVYISLSSLTLIAIVLVIVMSLTYINERNYVERQMINSVDLNTQYFGQWLDSKSNIVKTAYKFYLDGNNTYDLDSKFLLENEISDVYVGLENGIHIDFTGWIPPENYNPRIRPWYTMVKNRKEFAISTPYTDLKTMKNVVSLVMPLMKNGSFKGAMGVDILLDSLYKQVQKLDLNSIGNCWIVSDEGIIISHYNRSLINQNIENMKELTPVYKSILLRQSGEVKYSYEGKSRLDIFKKIPYSNWTLLVSVDQSIFYRHQMDLLLLFAGAFLLSLIFSTLIANFISMSISKPINEIVGFADGITHGNYSNQVDLKHHDEFLSINNSLNEMALSLKNNFQIIEEQKAELEKYNQNLETIVESRTKELEIANKNLLDTQEELVKIASTDFLTGLYNRRNFYAIAENEHSRARRTNHFYSLLMLDIDHFKAVNDTYGHAVGDIVLKTIANTIKACSRDYDISARFGGEEFIMLLPETTAQEAVRIAERIRISISETKIHEKKEEFSITVSIGVSTYCTADESIDAVIERADECLYKAKKSGKNKVVFI